jgi:hypothetical protein
MPLYIGELTGARAIQVGLGTSDATSASTQDVLFDVTTHEMAPAGSSGDLVLRAIAVTLKHTAGYSIGITPYIDGSPLEEQFFSRGAPDVGTDGMVTDAAYVRQRCTSCHARVRMTAASSGVVELVDIAAEGVILREQP